MNLQNQDPLHSFKYQIIEELSRGGMGIIYKAFAPQLDRFVALKVIISNEASEQEMERFIQEAKAFQQCKRMGYKHSKQLIKLLEQEKNRQENKHKSLVFRIMQKVAKNPQESLINMYAFTIAKIQKPKQ